MMALMNRVGRTTLRPSPGPLEYAFAFTVRGEACKECVGAPNMTYQDIYRVPGHMPSMLCYRQFCGACPVRLVDRSCGHLGSLAR